VNTKIILTTLNARYHHSSFGLRYLYANLKELKTHSRILEFTTSQNTRDIAESILRHRPSIVGFGVYIWNTRQTHEVISMLKKICPELIIVLGGPEVSYETQSQMICQSADFVIQGEADFLFYEFCKNYLDFGKIPSSKVISGILPEVTQIDSPYPYYSDEDIRNRVIYVEASRGCPYKCEYCLSSLDKSVRSFNLDFFLSEMEQLIQRGVRQFKFVDRTFNLSISTSARILNFFLDRISFGLFLHFEMVPDRLPAELRELITQFPPGSLQFEIGIQTWSVEVGKLVSRRQDFSKIKENFRFLTQETSIHIHADLIVGLPGETLESFAMGFDSLSELNPHEIQVGILKRLKGTPIVRHDQTWGMVYQDHPPFQILKTKTMSFEVIQTLGRFSQFWDLYANSGNFKGTIELLKSLSSKGEKKSWFWTFFDFSLFLSTRHPQGTGIALMNLVESAWIYLTQNVGISPSQAREILVKDYTHPIKRDIPAFLREESLTKIKTVTSIQGSTPRRQNRHLAQH
jgi:radical SAM superfamily enzyme YgiQ (UPF0313 family)